MLLTEQNDGTGSIDSEEEERLQSPINNSIEGTLRVLVEHFSNCVALCVDDGRGPHEAGVHPETGYVPEMYVFVIILKQINLIVS